MSKINIYETRWLNMVFEGRNKAYGAYQLRTENPKTTVKAFFSALLLLGGAALIPIIVNSLRPEEAKIDPPAITDQIIQVVELMQPEEPVEELQGAEPLRENTVKYVDMVVKSKSEVTEDPLTNNQLDNAKPAQLTNEVPVTATNPVVVVTTDPGPGKPSNSIETTATLEMQPQYPGGIGAFLSSVGRNFKAPEVDENIKTLKVLVYFVIEKDGTLSNIRVTRDPGYNLGKEALRVLNGMKTKWSPGYKNGEPVRTAYNLPITINVN